MELALALLGVAVGFALSFLFWWMLNHRLVPDIAFASGISKLPSGPDGQVVYRIKIKNTGRRHIIDVECRVHVHLPRMDALGNEVARDNRIMEIPLRRGHLFALPSKGNGQLWLDPSKAITEYLPAETADLMFSQKDGALESLLTLRSDSFLKVQVLAYDSFSGARKYYVSQEYGLENVQRGPFDGMTVAAEQAPPEPDLPRSG